MAVTPDAGLFWIGNDGNVWVADSRGVRADNNYINGAKLLREGAQAYVPAIGNYTRVADPAGRNTQQTDPTNTATNTTGFGYGSGSSFVDTSGARASTQSSLDSLDRQLANMNQSALDQHNQLINQYDEEDATNRQNYESQVAKNESTRSGGISQALAAAAQGGRGLRSALASMGALGGTGSILANRAIASSANKDVGGVNETFDTNAEGLNTAWGNTEREQRQRREEAKTGLENARIKNAGSIASQRQNLLRDMAGFWEQAGNKTEASNWMARISGENPTIEQASRAAIPDFQRRAAAFSPQALKGYLAGNQNMAVHTSGGNSGLTVNSPIYATRQRREEYA